MTKELFKDDDPGTYDPKTKRHLSHRIMVNSESGDITIVGKTPPDKLIPKDWKKVSENRYVPTWPTCRYRRLSVKVNRHEAPNIDAHCIHEEVKADVNHEICKTCPLFEAIIRPPILTDEEKEAIFKREYRDDVSEIDTSTDGEIHISKPKGMYEEEYWNQMEEDLFQKEMHDSKPTSPKAQKNTRSIHRKWGVPCIHRYEQPKEDCGACSDIMCNNPEAEKYGLKILRKDCKSCPVAEKPT